MAEAPGQEITPKQATKSAKEVATQQLTPRASSEHRTVLAQHTGKQS